MRINKSTFKTVFACALLVLVSACKKTTPANPIDRPRLTPNVALRDITFHSNSLNRDMLCRVVMPSSIPTGVRFPVVYLLHGGGDGGFRDWTNYTDVARFAERGLILVMPEADESYYTNSADHPDLRYEDYIVKDLIADVETRFPAADRAHRAVVGISMGGFGAVKLSLHHPELFSFAAGFSSALDVPTRPFSIQRWANIAITVQFLESGAARRSVRMTPTN